MSEPAAPPISGRFTPFGVVALTLGVFGVVVALVTWQQRAGMREQILGREAERLEAVAALQLDLSAEAMGEEAANVPGALFVAVLKVAQFRGVMGVRVFDAAGAHSASDGVIGPEGRLPAVDWAEVSARRAVVRLRGARDLEELSFVEPAAEDAELIEALVPLGRTRGTKLLGAAQFWLDGTGERAELRRHDERLWFTAGLAWIGGSVVIGGVLWGALRRIEAANGQLRRRSEDLQRANRELVLAAKTSALGTVTAHLMHELKNPIAGLETIVAGQGDAAMREAGGELAAASQLTRRLRTMVNDVVGVLRDEQQGAHFELTAAEVVELVRDKVRGDAAARGVALETSGVEAVSLPGRQANLATLVLRNLAQNAVEAVPAGGRVTVRGGRAADGGAEFFVEDNGPGLSAAVRARLFQPCASTKEGGSGIGLALSQQIAQQAGGRLELVRSDERGTSFRLVLAAEA